MIDLPLVLAIMAFTPDYDQMAKDWYVKGMDNWLVKGIKESWIFLKKGSIRKAGLDLINFFYCAQVWPRLILLNSDHGTLRG